MLNECGHFYYYWVDDHQHHAETPGLSDCSMIGVIPTISSPGRTRDKHTSCNPRIMDDVFFAVVNHLQPSKPYMLIAIPRGTGYSTSIYLLDKPLKTTQHKNDATITKPSWWFQPIWKILVKLDHFFKVRGENKKYWSCHQLETHPNSATACVPPPFFRPGATFPIRSYFAYFIRSPWMWQWTTSPTGDYLQQTFEAGCHKKSTKANQTARKGLDDTVDGWNPKQPPRMMKLSHC